MSPLLFIIVLELLLRSVQKDDFIKGIKIKNYLFKYRAYADDVVFFVQNPEENTQRIKEKIEEFGQLAGLFINKKKSKIPLKVASRKEEIEGKCGCEVVHKVKYLGIELTNKNIDLVKNNYEKT